MPQTPTEDHFEKAARRHHEDAVYLHDDGRLPNADHHYGFAVECALKSLLLRYTQVSAAPKPSGRAGSKPWVQESGGQFKEFGHLPDLWSDVALQLHGRTASKLLGELTGSAPFSTWSVHDRYRDGSAITEADVNSRRAASVQILVLHQQAHLAGGIP